MWRRGRSWYLKRELPGLGRVYKSLGTVRATEARRREELVLRLAEEGRLELVRAWLADELTLAELLEAHGAGQLHEVTRRLREPDVPLADAVVQCLEAKAADVRPFTLDRYRASLTHFVRFAGPAATVRGALTTDQVQAFKGARRASGAAEATVNNDLIAVSVLVTYCRRKGWLSERPVVTRFPPRVRIRYLEPAELALYLAAVRPRLRPLFELLVGSGLRLGEALALRVADLRFGAREARALVEDAKSTAGVRAVFLPPWVAASLQEHIRTQGLGAADRLFPVDRWQAQDEHYRACRLAGIVGYTLHDHRHTAAVHLARAGMPLPLLAQQLGHATIAMTMRYARFHAEYADVGRYFARAAAALSRASAPARVQSRVQAEEPVGDGPRGGDATRWGRSDKQTGPAGLEPATPGFGDRCSTS
jgi:integrase